MDTLEFWRFKLAALLHDPPGKPLAMVSRTGGHEALADRIAEAIGVPAKELFRAKAADHMASGADRPVVSPPRRSSTVPYQVDDSEDGPYNMVVHPLAQDAWVQVAEGGGEMPRTVRVLRALGDEQVELLRELAREEGLDWDDAASIERLCYKLWRSLRGALKERRSGEAAERDLLWHHMPADTRCPDHSVWEHLRVTSALAFRAVRKSGRQPWLFTFSLSPVQDFLRHSRTSRDLWIGSFLLSDLAWHAMLPVVERYGPDAVVYPDLRGNPRVDTWLQQTRAGALPPDLGDPASYAAVLPATFTAIVPVGGAGHLEPLAALGESCRAAVEARWKGLAGTVYEWLRDQTPLGEGSWTETWWRQHTRAPVSGAWNAVEWLRPETTAVREVGALPGEEGEEEHDDATLAKIDRRQERLEPWVSPDVWTHYEVAREVFARTHASYLKEGGFDYALLHHQLRSRHGFRKATRSYPPIADERGEKCTVCRQRAALFNEEQTQPSQEENLDIDHHRSQVRQLWADIDDRGDGRDRLCGICALKRFLVTAAETRPGSFNTLWAGAEELALMADAKIEPRVPFPATSTVAAQGFLAEVATHPQLAGERRAVERAHDAALRSVGAGKFRTSFARSLARLAAAEQHGDSFLELDTQTSVFPSAVRGQRDRLEEEGKAAAKEAWEILYRAVAQLRRRAKTLEIAPPRTRFAVVRLDGDRLGALLLGDPRRIASCWNDVLHPYHRRRMLRRDSEVGKALANAMSKAGWPALLEARRLMGPSLHAFVSRTLAEFSHRVVPWVVEREFGGRLIYAGGDDLLALAPAEDALAMAARLAQLFSAAWVVDTRPRGDAWSWRRHGRAFDWDPARASRRFVVARRGYFPDHTPLRLPLGPDQIEPAVANSAGHEEDDPPGSAQGQLLAMMGPGASLSAGIAYGHFKTPLGHLLAESGRLLEMAKKRAGRSAVALSYASRGGEKASIALPWGPWEDAGANRGGAAEPPAHDMMGRLIEAFREDTVPGRLPYKLRQDSHSLATLLATTDEEGAPGSARRDALMRGLLRRATSDQPLPGELERAVLALWRAGLRLRPDEPERSAEGLLVCRGLAADDDEEDFG